MLLAAALVLGACDRADAGSRCLDRAALVGGGTGPDYLGLGAVSRRAIVSVEVVTAAGEVLAPCSGAIVAERWALTAAHCTSGEPSSSARVHVGIESACEEIALHAAKLHVHPELDLLALELERPVSELRAELVPLALALDAPPHVELGSLVVLAGFGRDEHGARGVRELLVETIVGVSPAAWTVAGSGPRGACAGDSGGPLLHRDAISGAPLVLGVLSEGDPSCRGRDVYTRVDAARGWLQTLGLDTAGRGGDQACEQIALPGRCLGRLAVSCEAGALRTEVCPQEQLCGYDGDAQRFGCLPDAALSPCGDVDQAGRCEHDAAVWCEQGERRADSCPAKGATCARGAVSGQVSCLPYGGS